MSHRERIQKAQAMIVHIQSILEEHGPLNPDALVYFLRERTGDYVHASDLYFAISVDDGEVLIDSAFVDGNLVRLRSKPEEPARLPFHDNYVAAYYKLYLNVKSLSGHPELLTLPNAWLDKIFGEDK